MNSSGRALPAEPLHVPTHPVRVVTAASLFDGHDAAINIMRRILQAQGAEVIHLGHNRSVDDVVKAVVEEDAAAVAVSSYQGGHVEYFTYLVDRLAAEGSGHVRVYGGGGGVIVREEIAMLAERGVRIFSPEDGQRFGLAAMVNTIIEECDVAPSPDIDLDELAAGSPRELARVLTALECSLVPADAVAAVRAAAESRVAPVIGITGTGGSGKSSLTDELLLRLQLDQQDKVRVAVLAVDPSRRRAGGALLGDRIRMAVASSPRVFFRSIATRGATEEVPPSLPAMIDACRSAGFDLVVVETPGIGQRDAAVTALADVSVYVMTPEYGAPSQLEKIDMLDLADLVVINKFERRGAEDALRDVRRQVARNRETFGQLDDLPVFGSVAARFNDDGVTAVYQYLRDLLRGVGAQMSEGQLEPTSRRFSTQVRALVPPNRVRYLADVTDVVRGYHRETDERARALRRLDALREATAVVPDAALEAAITAAEAAVDPGATRLLATYDDDAERLRAPDSPFRESLAGTRVPRIALPGSRIATSSIAGCAARICPAVFRIRRACSR